MLDLEITGTGERKQRRLSFVAPGVVSGTEYCLGIIGLPL